MPLASSSATTAPAATRDRAASAGIAFAPAVVVALVGARVLLLPALGPFNDEAYYWEWSRRLATGYYDHPPLVAWILAGTTRLLGHSRLAVHLPAFALSLATTAVVFRLALALFPGRRALAWSAVAALNAAPLFGLGAVFTTPDAPLLFLWASALLLAWRAVHGAPRRWYAVGCCAGLGLLAKYGAILLPPTLLVFLLHPRHRRWLARPEPWLGLALAVLVFAPVVLWNDGHGWASFRFQVLDRFGGAFRPWRTVPRFLAAQQALTTPLWLVCLAGLWRSARLGWRGSDAHWLLAAGGAVTLGFYAVASPFTFVNPNWLGPAYLALVVAAADVTAGWRSRAWRAVPVAVAAAVTLLFYLQAVTLVVPLSPRLDFATDLVGWPEVGARLRALATAPPGGGRTFVYASRFQLSAQAAFHVGPDVPVTRLGGKRRDTYDDWRAEGPRPGDAAIYFCDDHHYAPPREPFRACEPAGSHDVVRGGRTVRTFYFWRCVGYGEGDPSGGAATAGAPR